MEQKTTISHEDEKVALVLSLRDEPLNFYWGGGGGVPFFTFCKHFFL